MANAKIYDAAIIGGGPAGLSAAIYCRRKLLETLVVSMDVGGQVLITGEIENYLGYLGRSGIELAGFFEQQAKQFGVDIVIDEVEQVSTDSDVGGFKVKSSQGEYHAKAVIVTGGSEHRRLDVPGEEAFIGRGVSFCATCDAPFARDRHVAVIGGGNTALQSAELLARYAKKVYIIHRRAEFRADELLIDRAKKLPNIEMLMDTMVTAIKGEKRVETATIKDLSADAEYELKIDMIFVEIGKLMKLSYISNLIQTNQWGQIAVDREQKTSRPGIFAAGDITDRKYGQAIIAAGDGAVAALSAYDYLTGKKSTYGPHE